MDKKKNVIIGVIAVSTSAILWGLDGVVLTPKLFSLNVGYVVFVLHLIPFLLMNTFMYKEYRKVKQFNKKDWLALTGIAVFGGAIGTLSVVKALFLVNFEHLSFVVILQKLQPIFAITLASVLLKERLRKNFILWASIAILAGYFLTFGFNSPHFNTDSNNIEATLYALLAAFSFGSSTVFSKIALSKCNFKTLTFFRYGLTSLIMLIFIAITGQWQQYSSTTSSQWIIFLIIGTTTGSGAIFLYYFGLKRIKAIIGTICELLFPLSAILFDYIFYGNVLSAVQWISAVVMIFAIISLNADNAKVVKQKS
ncbi:MAG: DMT family transporter [Hyphomicrobiales bacterium]